MITSPPGTEPLLSPPAASAPVAVAAPAPAPAAPIPARPAQPSISCVVPAFNEADNLGPLLSGLTAQLAALSDRWEIIVVDDGSVDATPLEMLRWTQRPGVRCLALSRNFGKEAAQIGRAHV